MQKWIAATGVVVVGVVLLVIAFTANLFSVAPAFEDLTDGFRDDVMTTAAVEQSRADISGLVAVSEEFSTTVAPTLAGALGMDTAAFNEFVGGSFPAVATGMAQLPAIAAEFTGVIDLMDSQIENFADADAIPSSSLPATTLPWVIAGIGVLAIAAGAWMFMRGRSGAFAALVLGIVVIAATLVLSLVGKAGAADDMNDAFRPAYTEELVSGSAGALQVVGAMGNEMSTSMIPALAVQMNMTEAEVQGFIGESFPATAAALQSMPDALGRFEALVGAFDAQLENYQAIQDTALAPIAWTVLFSGIIITLLALWGLMVSREATATAAETARKERPLVGSSSG